MDRVRTVHWSHRLAEAYCSDLAYFAGLVVLWELLVILAGLWLVHLAVAVGVGVSSGAVATAWPLAI
jgi:hypothetical protein